MDDLRVGAAVRPPQEPQERLGGPEIPPEGVAARVPPEDHEYEDFSGPPSQEDDAWFTHHVASLGYPRLRRDPKPMEGQAKLVWPDGPISTT